LAVLLTTPLWIGKRLRGKNTPDASTRPQPPPTTPPGCLPG